MTFTTIYPDLYNHLSVHVETQYFASLFKVDHQLWRRKILRLYVITP